MSADSKFSMPARLQCIRFVCAVVLQLITLLPAPVAAQSPAKPGAQKPAADEVTLPQLLTKVYAAYGSKEALLGQEMSMVVQGQAKLLDAQPAVMRIFRQTRKGQRIRIDEEIASDQADKTTSSFTVFDGDASWKVTAGKLTEPADEPNKMLCENSCRLPSVLARFDDAAFKFKLLGRTRYRGNPVFAVEAAGNYASAATIFIDQATYLVNATTYVRNQQGAPVTVFDEFSDYRPSGATVVPFKQVQFVAGKPKFELDLDSCTTGSAISDAEFKRPGEPAFTHLSRPITVPFEFLNQEIVVKARINGSDPVDFLVDTGASDTIIDRRTAAEHYLDQKGDLKIVTAGGTITMPASKLEKLEIGSLPLAEVPALILDLTAQSANLGRPLAGILGASALNPFVVTFDFAKHMITFQEPDTYQPPAGSTTVPLENRRGTVVRGLINGKDEELFLVDTGASLNHLTEATAKKYASGQPAKVVEGAGLDQQSVKLGSVTLASVQLGGQKLQRVSFTYHQEPQPDKSGFFGSSEMGILGNPFWQNFLLTVDHHRQRLVLYRKSSEQSAQQISDLITTGDTKAIAFRDFRAAEIAYQQALAAATALHDAKNQARIMGRLGNLRRIMAKDLHRPEQAKLAYDYFNRAAEAAHKLNEKEVEGRILADWSILYSDNGQNLESMEAVEQALLLAPGDPQVNVDYAINLYRHGQIIGMRQYVERALSLDPSNWQALWYQVKLGELLDDKDREKSALKDILRFYPWSKLASEKLSALVKPAAGKTVQAATKGNTP